MHEYPITPNFSVVIAPRKHQEPVSNAVRQHIDAIWTELTREQPSLFNGQLLNCLSMEKDSLVGEFVEYKHYMAQIHDPSLREVLDIKPVGVCAITTDGTHVLLGQRSQDVSLYQGYYEVIPAGTVDATFYKDGEVAIKKLLLHELKEEAGIAEKSVESIELKYVIYDPDQQSYEIAAIIKVPEQLPVRVQEHTHFSWLSLQELEHLLQSDLQVVPVAEQVLRLLFFPD